MYNPKVYKMQLIWYKPFRFMRKYCIMLNLHYMKSMQLLGQRIQLH